MEQSINVFRYQPLQTTPQEFRLVLIQPGSFASPISCTLQHAYLQDNPSFEALSYVWGDPKDTVPIFLDNHIFCVTRNLESALRHLRWDDAPRTFWIDAICIDQRNVRERGHQVQSMGEFYRAAERTTVWLGKEFEHTGLAFEYILEAEVNREMEHLLNQISALNESLLGYQQELIQKLEEEVKISQNLISSRDSAGLDESRESISRMREEKENLEKRLQAFCPRILEIHKELEREGDSHVRASPHSGRTHPLSGQIGISNWLMGLNPHNYTSDSGNQLLEDGNSTSDIDLIDMARKELGMTNAIEVLLQQFELSEDTLAKIDEEVVALVNNTWWSRSWVIQEVAMSRDIAFQCGSVLASWEGVYSTVEHTPAHFVRGSFPLILKVLLMSPKSKNVGQTFKALEPQMELLDLLESFRYCEATDPRDKIYALMGLAFDVQPGDINIDYTLPVQYVYKDIVKLFLSKHQSLDILGAIMQQKSPFQGLLPSWVPDWSLSTIHVDERSLPRKVMSLQFDEVSVSKAYFASGDTLVSPNRLSDTDSLVLTGFVFDTLDDLCEPAVTFVIDSSAFNTSQQQNTIIQEWDEKALHAPGLLNPYTIPCGRQEAFWRTLVADMIGDWRATEEPLVEEMFNVWSGRAEAPAGARSFTEPFVSAVVRASHNRRFGITSKGYMVLAPAGAMKSDLVCVLFGGQTPFILREEHGRLHLVGACYVHGIMFGEAMEDLKSGRYEVQDFVLQ
jgi:hypothetical protein